MSYKRKRPTIGVLVGWHAYEGTLHSFLDQLFCGIQAAARERDCNLLLACGVGTGEMGVGRPAWPILSSETDFVPVGPWNTDGLIAVVPLVSRAGVPYGEESRYVEALTEDDFPVVFAGCGRHTPAVIPDNEDGIRQALAHLVAHGHRRIAFVAGIREEQEGDSGHRLRAYRATVQEWDLACDPDLIAFGYHNPEGGRRAMQQILDSGAGFTAVLCSNDESAIGAMEALRGAGLLVPGDVAVVGFDDRLEARSQIPPLTTVHYPIFELGYRALMLMLDRVDGLVEKSEVARVPTRLIVRESCGCLPGAARGVTADDRPEREDRSAGAASQVVQDVAAAVYNEVQRLSLDEISYLSRRLLEAFRLSAATGDAASFHTAARQVIQRLSSQGDDPQAWQVALSMLRDRWPDLREVWGSSLQRAQVEDMLHLARISISEIARSHYTRRLIHQGDAADQLGRMTARFLSAQDELEIHRVLMGQLPRIGIEHAAVFLFQATEDDPVAWSVLQSSPGSDKDRFSFRTRDFPPDGFYPEDEAPFHLALLPLLVREGPSGFVAFDAGNLAPCADVVRQLGAALRAVWLYREAVEGRRLAEEANRLKSRFLSVVSHELRTPLNLISGLSDILLKEAAGEGLQDGERRDGVRVRREDLKRIHVSAQHLDGLIRDVLDLARSEAGQLTLSCEPLDLAEILEAVSVIGRQLARDRGLTWEAHIDEDLPSVWGDRTRLRQVVLNLVNNAIKFTSRGGVTLEAGATDGSVTVTVRDTGLGIPAEEQRVIFDEFRQSERTTARGYGGLGLGLAICKRLVEMHGGEIGVRSSGQEGGGSTFTVTLPAMDRQPAVAGSQVPLSAARRVMLLAKDPSSGELLRERLSARGFQVEVHTPEQGGDWMGWLRAGAPEAVVLDLGLASERGWEILKLLKENPVTQDVPVLFYTLAGGDDSGSVLQMDYLTKPMGTAELADALRCRGLLDSEQDGGAGRKILLVDDEPGVLQMHAKIVQAQLPSCDLIKARDGREALELIRRERPHLVLLDLMMPELDGFAVLETMREEELSRDIPVIVLTGKVLTESDMRRLNQGVASVLEKGVFSAEEALQHIEDALERTRELGAEARRMARTAMAYVHEHWGEPISRQDIAAHVGLSERHLTRCFRREVGVPPMTYLNRYRVRQAKRLLERGDRTITEVAMESGFSSGSYFARVFGQEVGVSPSAYQRGERPSSSAREIPGR